MSVPGESYVTNLQFMKFNVIIFLQLCSFHISRGIDLFDISIVENGIEIHQFDLGLL